jgi:hypothetical protein
MSPAQRIEHQPKMACEVATVGSIAVMSAASRKGGSSRDGGGEQPRPGGREQHSHGEGERRPDVPVLSVLDEALRRALASVPRDQVVKCIATALPINVLVDQSARLHGGKVRKVSVSMPEELAEAVRARTGAGGFSRYVTEAVQEQVRLDLLDDLSAELEAQFGPIPDEIRQQTRRTWPNYTEE